MDIRKVKKLIELLEESGIDELEIREGEESVRISRHSNKASTPPSRSTPPLRPRSPRRPPSPLPPRPPTPRRPPPS